MAPLIVLVLDVFLTGTVPGVWFYRFAVFSLPNRSYLRDQKSRSRTIVDSKTNLPLARSWNSLRDFYAMRNSARNEPETIHCTLRFARQRDYEGLVNDGSKAARQNCIRGKF